MHKVHILCWISHGNIVNTALNNFGLTKKCLSTFIPSAQCYPKDKTDVTYFEQISKWYKSQMALKEQTIYPTLKKLPPIATSLALQIDSRQAICKRDFVLIFVILLRSIGIQCRLIINLPVVPMKPPQKDLCSASIADKKPPTRHDDTELKSKPTKNQNIGKRKVVKKSSPSTSSNDKTNTENVSASSLFRKFLIIVLIFQLFILLQIIIKTPSKIKSGENQSPSKIKPNSLKSKVDKNVKLIDSSQNSTNILKRKSETKSTNNISETTPPKQSKMSNGETTQLIEPNVIIESPKFEKNKNKNSMSRPSTSQAISKNNANKSKIPNLISSPISRRTRNSAAKKIISNPPQLDGATSESPKSNKRNTKPNLKRLKKKSVKDDEDDSEPSTSKKKFKVQADNDVIQKLKRIDRRVLSTDNEDIDDNSSNNKKLPSMDFWVEVYCEADEKWMPINLFKLKFNCIEEIRVI